MSDPIVIVGGGQAGVALAAKLAGARLCRWIGIDRR